MPQKADTRCAVLAAWPVMNQDGYAAKAARRGASGAATSSASLCGLSMEPDTQCLRDLEHCRETRVASGR